MAEIKGIRSWLGKSALAFALAGAMALGGASAAFADDEPLSTTYTLYGSTVTVQVPNPNLIKTYGVRAGSAGADFLGVTNTNFDYTPGSASSPDQYTGYTSLPERRHAGLAIWGSSVNENANPYYANLLYHALTGTPVPYEATTWMSNPSTSSWGDSNGSTSYTNNDPVNGAATIAGLEYSPQIIFGANKYTNWYNAASDGSNSGTVIYDYIDQNCPGYEPLFVSNDATNIYTQVYTMGQLASAADGLKANSSGLITRYDNNSAAASATSYRYAINGQLLYIASQIDAHAANSAVGTGMKTVAYLYAIDGDMSGANTAYFFTPTASGLLAGDDTGKGVDSNPNKTSATNPDDNYAANNPTINMGYMGTLPFVTNTYDSGVAYVTTTVYDDAAGHDETVSIPGIIMKVEDIYKANPACTLSIAANATDQALKDVDVIIFNSTTATSLNGTSGGKNSSYVVNTTPLTANTVVSWAARHGFSGTVLSGDDFGTSNNQWDANGTRNDGNQAPLLYCQRNYTADKNARAAWAFSKVYPELYKLNGVEKANATYGYWVDKIYHVNTSDVNTVAGILTNQNPNDFAYSADICAMVENNAVTGYAWWTNQSHNLSIWDSYKFYNGSTRASYYSGDSDSEEQLNTIEIFGPTNS